ncbi:radical SAM family heme chaperone HemW [Rothia aerolata]|uniref:Heme chaperone HemW n=1 Tax=Rothia aerolata TaxID=1812262 RepID=A0A917INC8_9MICC|nr:radical SAM family heme chaperone HemW [Rothia aerolata]GGH57641.1 coproporphyrinogen III oxidase [Rothia aerolata]
MTPAQPLGNPAPANGRIPAASARLTPERDFSLYVHVPFCSVRCGYCDFNTYAVDDFGNGVGLAQYADDAVAELDFAHRVMQESGVAVRPMYSVFFGGGTPTKLPAKELVKILQHAISLFGLEEGAEVTTEANPDSVTAEDLKILAQGGFTRVSFGMQSAVPEVLAVLDRTHTPSNVPKVVDWAKEAGLQVSVDLIYGTPGETLDQWRQSLSAAVSYRPDHISAYSLIVEEGTKLWAQIRRGDYSMPDDDLMADMYLAADEILSEAGYSWYEVSNFSSSPETRSKHNLAYWHNQDWWGIGPGAHSHMAGTRWWNVKHPVAYAGRVRENLSPAAAREVLPAQTQDFEKIMLELRILEGLERDYLEKVHGARELDAKLTWLVNQGLIDAESLAEHRRVRLTLRGRLLGDAVTRELLPDTD